MNQKYFCGVSISGMDKYIHAYFEATPESIASFICTYRANRKTAVCTIDGKPFLTAKYGLIDIMPDQKYFAEKLRPILIPIQHGAIPIPPMKAVPQEVAEAESCPKPDWNYLRWDGYSDEKYKAILDGSGLLDWEQDGEIHKIELQVSHYMDQNNLDIKMVCWDSGEPEFWKNLTVNLKGQRDKNCAFVDSSLKDNLPQWMSGNGLAKHTGLIVQYGPDIYSEYLFNAKRLRELDAKGYEDYSKLYDGNRTRRQQKRRERER